MRTDGPAGERTEAAGLVGPLPLAGGEAAGARGRAWPAPAMAPTRYASLPVRWVFAGVTGRRKGAGDDVSPLRAAISVLSSPALPPRTGGGPAVGQARETDPLPASPLTETEQATPVVPGVAAEEAPGVASALEAPVEGEPVPAPGDGEHRASVEEVPLPGELSDEAAADTPGPDAELGGWTDGRDGTGGAAGDRDEWCGAAFAVGADGADGGEVAETAATADRDARDEVRPDFAGPAAPAVAAATVRGRPRGLLGVDIGSRSLKVVQARVDRGVLTIWRCGTWPVPAGAVAEGLVRDVEAVAALLREAGARCRARYCVGAVDAQRVILRQLELPLMSGRELEALLRVQGDYYLPLPWGEAEVAHRVLGREGGRMRVLLVAAHAQAARAVAGVVRAGGLVPRALETDSVALARVLHFVLTGERGFDPAGTLAIGVHLGAEGTLVVASREGTPLFARVLPVGGRHFTEALARALGIGEEAAEAYKRARGLEIPELRPMADRLAGEVVKTVEYYLDQTERGLAPRVCLTGGGARLRGLGEVLQSWLEQALVRWGRLPAGRWIGPAVLPEGRVRWGCSPGEFGPEHFLALGLSMRGGER